MNCKMRQKIYWIKCIVFFSFLFLTQEIFSKSKLPRVSITVWVHGTHPAKRLFESRFSPIRSQVYAPRGLSLAKDLPEYYNFCQIAKECCRLNPADYNLNHFYLYGWNSAKITSRQRKKAGKELFKDLDKLLSEYKKHYKQIDLRLVGFSHGGNVILNCLSNMPFEHRDIETEVVLIATPIQESTRWYANTPYVNRVYSLYSDRDWIQRIDVQKFHQDAPKNTPLLSGRTFEEFDKVIQVNFKFNGKSVGHIGYRPVMKYVPDILQEIDKQVERTQSRRHIGLNFKTK